MAAELRFAEVTQATRADFERLFESKGGPSYCWCMAWRDMPNRQHASNAERKREITARIEADTPVGILALRAARTGRLVLGRAA